MAKSTNSHQNSYSEELVWNFQRFLKFTGHRLEIVFGWLADWTFSTRNPNQFAVPLSSMDSKAVKLKALVNKENETIVFVESDRDFVDSLFSFLTMPMGTIIKLTRGRPPKIGIGCMNNLYGSVENLDSMFFQNEARKIMLLQPRNGSAEYCDRLILKIVEPLRYFCCWSSDCTAFKCKLLSYYKNASCGCGEFMGREMLLLKDTMKIVVCDSPDGGGFVNGKPRLIITDGLKVMPASTIATLSFLSKLGVLGASSLEERTFDIRANTVLNLLKWSLLSKTPLTETLLRRKPVYEYEVRKQDFGQDSPVKRLIVGDESKTNGKICVRLIVSKSKEMVCYAEGSEDFVDLLFSFLTVPLGYIAKEMPGGRTKGSISELYNSVEDLYFQGHLKSKDHREVLLHPKSAPYSGNQLLDLEEAVNPQYYFARKKGQNSSHDILTTDFRLIPFRTYSEPSILTAIESKWPYEEATDAGGFLAGPAMFTITDDLIVTPLSPSAGLSVLRKLEVPSSDIEERVVHVSNKEALNLLVSSFTSECALTDTFIRRGTVFPLDLSSVFPLALSLAK